MSDSAALVTPTAAALAGGAIVALGAFLPWMTTETVTMAGIDSNDGVLTLVLAGITVGYTIIRDFDARLVGAVGVVCTVIGTYDILNPIEPAILPPGGATPPDPSPAIGVYLTLVGGLVLLGALGLDYREQRS